MTSILNFNPKTPQSGLGARALPRLFFILALLLPVVSAAAPIEPRRATGPGRFAEILQEKPFWRKAALWKALEAERKIAVSTTHSGLWIFKGAGIVEAPREVTFEKARELDRLRRIPERFSRVAFDPLTSVLEVQIHFLGRQWPLRLQLSQEEIFAGVRLYFKSLGPWLPTLEGVFEFKDHQRQSTEVAFYGIYSGHFEWIPNFVVKVASEGVMHHVAEQLRKGLEADYKKK
jgi:hypothetical protein